MAVMAGCVKEAQSVGSAPGGMDKRTPCYSPVDLRLGAFVNVHGRRFFLHDCDEFTRGYYRESLGFSAEEMAGISVVEQAALHVPVRCQPAVREKRFIRWQSRIGVFR